MAPRVDTSLADPALTKFLSRTAALPPDPAVLLKAKLATTSCIAGAPLNLAATDFVANGGSLPASCKQAKPQACVVTVPSPGIRKVDPKIDAAVARIRELLGDTSLLSHTHDKLAEITTIFQSLTAEQASVVFGKLSMAHLARWGHDIQRSPSTPFGYGGLTDADKQTLMGALATKLKGPQLLDVSTMFGSYEDTVKLGSIVAQKSSPETKIEFIKTMASKTTTGVAFRLETHFGSSEDFRGDPEAKAIAAVLGSLQGPAFAVGLNSLLPEQAAKVWVAAVGESIATTGGSPSCTVRYDPQLLLGMIKAAETATPDTRARVFAAAAEQLGTIMESTKAFGVISVGNKEQADHIAMAMAGLLNADQRPKGAVAPQDSGLEQMTSWLSKQIDPEGKAMSTFAYVMLSQKHSAELGSILRTLQSGADGNGVPVTRFERARLAPPASSTGPRQNALVGLRVP